MMKLPVSNKYIAKSEEPNQLNIFVFGSGVWISVGLGLIVPSVTELNLIARFHGLLSSLLKAGLSNENFSVDLKRIKNA